MARTPETTNGGAGGTIEVGATGTVGSLMSRELEPHVKGSAQASAAPLKKLQTAPVSVPCGYSPKRSQLRRSLPPEPGSSSGSGSGSRSPPDVQKPKPRRDGQKNKSTGAAGNAEKKGGRTYNIVEVVDLKCSNPMSSRLRKLGFSKLSESIA